MHDVKPAFAGEQHLTGVRQVALKPKTVDSALTNVPGLATEFDVPPTIDLDRSPATDPERASTKLEEQPVGLDALLTIRGLVGEVLHRLEAHDRVELAIRLIVLPGRNLSHEIFWSVAAHVLGLVVGKCQADIVDIRPARHQPLDQTAPAESAVKH